MYLIDLKVVELNRAIIKRKIRNCVCYTIATHLIHLVFYPKVHFPLINTHYMLMKENPVY